VTRLTIALDLDYDLGAGADAILAVEAAALPDQAVAGARIEVPDALHFARVPAGDGIGERLMLRLPGRLACRYRAEVEVTRPDPDLAALPATPVHLLPGAVVPYLMASRFCPADRFQSFVASEFGGLAGGAAAAAMAAWCADRMTYAPASDPHTTALESFVERRGVCRDYAHLMITFARAAGIPARMASVYAPGVAPPDFHAVAELWLGGGWVAVDATGMARPSEMARICVGRDAAEVAFLTVYGQALLVRQQVQVTAG
jgi:transglutaminase-like putative cysteine protease